ncbi:MAG: hemerythrin domain-containing protein [Burkholderiaceae bacterium]|nr:hemerythrin domain-containing protein [Burkholderiaceae bacterium]MCD6675021.1 hemerythrin domain-containing protein [Burkholderiaceae bacterium]
MAEQHEPASNTADPLRDFSRSHAGILIRLEQLRELATKLSQGGAERRALRERAHEIVSFFHEAVIGHHAEEEDSLFPAVARSAAAGDETALVVALAERLTREHRQIEDDWKAIEPALARLSRGRGAELDAGIVARLCDRYAAHAQFEESGYLPLAAKILDADDQASLALALHVRHSLDRVLGFL